MDMTIDRGMADRAHDQRSFARDIGTLGMRLRHEIGRADARHLVRIEIIGRLCGIAGLATAWIAPNPVSIFLLAQAMIVRFFIGHHVSHGGYDGVPGLPARFARRRFATGWRRLVDWPDWWSLDDWLYTHNQLHHPHTQSPLDADIMDSRFLLKHPRWVRFLYFLFATATWKFSYYAPRMHRENARRRNGERRETFYNMVPADLVDVRDPVVRTLWTHNYLPYVAWRFALPTLAAAPFGWWPAFSMLANLILAELVHNAQTFICIRPSHCAADIPLFTGEHRSRGEFYLQSVLGTVNYRCGGDINDILHGWTNYQVEHHLWPSLTLLQYRRAHPHVVAICAAHHVGYREAGVWSRYAKTARLFMGLEHQSYLDTAPLAAPA